MGVLHPKPGRHPVHTVHRVSAAALEGFLLLFGGLGLSRGLAFLAPVVVSQAPRSTADIAAAVELADAERARARHAATPEQVERLTAIDRQRSATDRRRAWQDSARGRP